MISAPIGVATRRTFSLTECGYQPHDWHLLPAPVSDTTMAIVSLPVLPGAAFRAVLTAASVCAALIASLEISHVD